MKPFSSAERSYKLYPNTKFGVSRNISGGRVDGLIERNPVVSLHFQWNGTINTETDMFVLWSGDGKQGREPHFKPQESNVVSKY